MTVLYVLNMTVKVKLFRIIVDKPHDRLFSTIDAKYVTVTNLPYQGTRRPHFPFIFEKIPFVSLSYILIEIYMRIINNNYNKS